MSIEDHKQIEVLGQWHFYVRPDGSHYAICCEGDIFETVTDIQDGTLHVQRKKRSDTVSIPVKIVLRLVELDADERSKK